MSRYNLTGFEWRVIEPLPPNNLGRGRGGLTRPDLPRAGRM